MGIDINTVNFLISAYEDGVPFGKVLTMGRQNLYAKETEVNTLIQKLKSINPEEPCNLSRRCFAHPIFQALKSDEVLSMDKSDFEGADILHDMNFPIAEAHKEQFDLIYDGGTLEHIFNFPVAIKNEMEMVKVGGHLIIQTPTNNWSGHGFYQFSPELYFRVLSEVNGYKIKRMVVFEWGPNKWYEVSDPADIASRVYVVNSTRTSLLILAERTAAVEINQDPPQQSDYAMSKWKVNGQKKVPVAAAQKKSKEVGIAAMVKSAFPRRVVETVKVALGKKSKALDYFSRKPNCFKAVER